MAVTSRFEISRQIHKSSYSMHSAHTHSYCEMYYLMHGDCNLVIQDKVYSITAGTIAFIPANVLHKTTYTGTVNPERLYIEFTENYISELVDRFGREWLSDNLFGHLIYIPAKLRPQVNETLDGIMEERSSTDFFSACMMKLTFESLIIRLLRYTSLQSNVFTNDNVHIADDTIQAAMNYISSNYQNRISLNDLAALLHLNASYLSKKFKAVNGMGFKEYLNNVRINHAEKLLLESKKDITEIALECGYENSNYFGDAFKRRNGISPTAFRKIKGNVEG